MENYDQYFRRVDSLAAAPRNSQSAYQFNSQYPANLFGGRAIQDLSISDQKIVSMGVDKLTAGTISVAMNLGSATSGTVILDGGNNRIVVHDGTTNRIVIGDV